MASLTLTLTPTLTLTLTLPLTLTLTLTPALALTKEPRTFYDEWSEARRRRSYDSEPELPVAVCA